MASSGLGDKVIEKIFRKFMDAASKWYDFIDASFLPVELKEKYKEEIRENLGKLQEAWEPVFMVVSVVCLKSFVFLRVETECERIPCSSAVSFFMVP